MTSRPSDILFGAKVATEEEVEQMRQEVVEERPSDILFGRKLSKPSDILFNQVKGTQPVEPTPDVSGIAHQIQTESLREKEIGGKTLQGMSMAQVLTPGTEEYDVTKPGPFMSEENKVGFMHSLNRIWNMAKNPYDVVKGTAEFLSLVPGFVAGLGSAITTIPVEIGKRIVADKSFTIEDLYNSSAKTMEQVMGMWNEGVTGPLGKLLEAPRTGGIRLAEKITGAEPQEIPKGDPGLIADIWMSPYNAVAQPLHALANSDTYKDYPNARGIIKFAADALGLALMGRIHRGGKEGFEADAEPIIQKATELDKAQKEVNGIPIDTIRAAQQKVLDAQKMQLELEAQEVQKNLDFGKLIAEDLSSKTEQIKQIKAPKKALVDEAINKAYEQATKGKPVRQKIERTIGPIEESPKVANAKARIEEAVTTPLQGGEVKVSPKEVTVDSLTDFYRKEFKLSKKDAKEAAQVDLEDVIPIYEKATGKKVSTLDEHKEMLDFWEKVKSEEVSDVDLQTGTREPVELSQELNPFRDTDVEAVTAREQFYETMKVDNPESLLMREVNRVNDYLNGNTEADIATARHLLSELAARADELRYDYFANSPEYPGNFLNFKESASEAARWARLAERKEPSGQKLFSIGGATAEGAKELKRMAVKAAGYFDSFKQSRKMKGFDIGYAAKQIKADSTRALIEQSETLLKQVRKNYPEEANRVISRQRAAAAGKGYGAMLYDQMNKEVFGGKSKAVEEAIHANILARRLNDIYKYKSDKSYKHQVGYGSEEVSNAVAIMEMVKDIPDQAWKAAKKEVKELEKLFGNLSPSDFKDVVRSTEAYFEWMRKIVDDLVAAGIKSEEEGMLLKAHDFRKFKSIRVEKLYDFDYDVKLRNETLKMTNSGVESLGWGSTKILEPDALGPAQEMFMRAYGSIANQEAKLAWKELADKHPENGIVSNKKVGGWSTLPYFENGKRKNLYVNPDAAKYMVTKSHDLSHRLTTIIRGALLAPVTRSLAVGASPAWATFVGLPMDVIHSVFTARTFDSKTGKFNTVYNPMLPAATIQIGMDMIRTLPDIYTRGESFKDYMKYGGSMPFLALREGRYRIGTKPPGDWAKFMDLLSYHGVSMELWVRAATADRVIRNRAKELGISYEEARKNKDLMYEAVHAARDRMDYNQGGWFVKALDQLGFIFLNAGVLGTRTYWRQAKDNPVDFTMRTAQIGVAAGTIATVGWMLWPEVMKEIPTEGNEKNLNIPLFPNHISAIDENGEKVYFYLKLRMDPGAAFSYKVFDALTRTYLYDRGLIDKEPDYGKLVDTLKQLGPYGFSLPPHLQGWFEYTSNYSWWKDRQMYTKMGGRTLEWPESRKEGMYSEDGSIRDKNISQFATDVSKVTGLSAPRFQGAAGNIIPRNNEFVMLTNGAYEWAFSDVPEELKSKHWLLTLAELPGVNRIIGVTRPGYEIRDAGTEPVKDERLKSIVRNGKLDFLAENYYWHGYGKESDIDEYIDSFEETEYYVVDAMRRKKRFVEEVKDLPHRDAWVSMFNTPPEAKAKHFYNIYKTRSDESGLMLDELYDVGYLTNESYDRFKDTLDGLRKVR